MQEFQLLAERDLISERVKEGIEAAKKKGVQFGRFIELLKM
ncbi:recombinase family protein [Candidatus Sulfurimonas marisnigri]|nr:recombinase family protein [Candidatus Sulfurimonas marisnigri]